MASRTILYIATSLDGFIARLDGSVSWLDGFHGVDLGQYAFEPFMKTIGTCLIGRKTYDQILDFGEWGYKNQETIVFSNNNVDVRSPRTTVTNQSPSLVVPKLKHEATKNIWLVGGGELNGAFLKAGLIDELLMFVMPVSLGAGLPLFGSFPQPQQWNILERHSFNKGIELTRATPYIAHEREC